MRIKLPNRTHLRVATLAILIVMCTLLILSAVFPFPEGTWDFLSIGVRQKASANPDWLVNFPYRYAINITGGAINQTDYQMRLKLYKQASIPIASDGTAYPIYYSVYPNAYYYNGVTYVAWQGDGEDPYVAAFTHSTQTWSSAYKVGDNPIGGSDHHGAPAIIVDDSGYIHVFFGCHGTACLHYKSDSAEDVTDGFTSQGNIGSALSYPRLIKDKNGTIWAFFRVSVMPSGTYVVVYNSGDSYASPQTLINVESGEEDTDGILMGSPAYDSTNDRIHIAWTYVDDTSRLDVYHAYFYIGATNGQTQYNLYTMDGTDLGTAISRTEMTTYCEIVDTGAYIVGYGAFEIVLDDDKHPHILFYRNTAGGQKIYYMDWDGSEWDTPVEVTDWVSGSGWAMFVTDDDDIEIFIADNYDVVKWTWNGSSWSEGATLLEGSDLGGDGCNVVRRVYNGLDGASMVTSGSDIDDNTNADLNVFLLNSQGAVVLGEQGAITLQGNCRDDFYDIRFTTSDGVTLLDHWLEEGTLVSNTSVYAWVAMNLTANVTNSIYLYTGNSSASSLTDGDGTFPVLFENFEWGSDTDPITNDGGSADWEERVGNGEISTDDKFGGTRALRLLDDPSYINCVAAASTNYAFRFRINHTAGTAIWFSHGNGTYRIFIKIDTSNNIVTYDGSEHDTGYDCAGGAWVTFEIANIDFATQTYDLWYGAAETLTKVADGAGMWTNSFNDGVLEFQHTDANNLFVDNVFERAYIEPEPTWDSFGSPETATTEITNSPNSNAFGTLATSTTGNTTINYFTITNTGTTSVDVTIYGTDMTGGDDTWTLSDTATAGENQYGLKAGLDDDDDTFDVIVRKTPTYNMLVSDLAEDGTQDWGLQLIMPSSLSGYDNNQMTATITLVASEAT